VRKWFKLALGATVVTACAISMGVPLCQKALVRTRESLLESQLYAIRTTGHEYIFDKQKAPRTLQDLVNEGYLRAVPVDPMTGSSQSWRMAPRAPGMWDVHSGSDRKSLEGTRYSDW
jgi:general secretion pathway protein G